MSHNIFNDAVNKATMSVRVNSEGGRSVSGNSTMNRGNSYNNRGNMGRGGRGGNRGRGTGGQRWQRGGRYNNSRGFGRGSRTQYTAKRDEDEEGDFVMNEERGSYGRDYGDRGWVGRNGRERSPESTSRSANSNSWWKVVVIGGRKHNRDWLIKRLKDTCRAPFKVVNYHFKSGNAVFFIDDESAVEPLRDASNRITTKDCSKIKLIVEPSTITPHGHNEKSHENESYTEEHNNVLRQWLSTRFVGELLKLDLSKVYSDTKLKEANIHGRIDQPKFMNAILELIHSLCPTLKILDLSNNRIFRLDNLRLIGEKCPALEELNLSDNEIRSTVELSKIEKHPSLIKLWFKGNPGQLQFTNNASYLAEIRKRLPSLKELDGVELPTVLKFDLDEAPNMPASKPFYAPEQRDYELVKIFIQNFYQVYDNDDVGNRQKLLHAYHNDVVFSLCCNTSVPSAKNNLFSTYIKISRNLKNVKDSKLKSQLIKRKKLAVVAFLTELPQTTHWLDSFSLDLTLSTLHMLCFTVQGVFLEGKDKTPRGFARTFVGAREPDQTFLVVNDELHIRSPTQKQLELLEKAKSNVPDATVQPDSASPTVSYTEEQQELIKKFSAESQMNVQYSLQCLISSSWDYQQAAAKFLELKTSNKIPPEAFINPQ